MTLLVMTVLIMTLLIMNLHILTLLITTSLKMAIFITLNTVEITYNSFNYN
jgi:hypothetical protein